MTRLALSGLLPGTDYDLQFRVTDNGVPGEWSPRYSLTTTSYDTQPAVPQNVTWEVINGSFHGEWDQVTHNVVNNVVNIDYYEVELVGFPGSVLVYDSATATSLGRVTYDLTFEQNVAKFNFVKPEITMRVRAVDIRGIKSEWTAPLTAVVAKPPTPQNLAGTPGYEAIDLRWDALTDPVVIGYRVYLSTAGGAVGTFNKVYEGTNNAYSFPTVMYNTDHYFYVVSYNAYTLESDPSAGVGPLRPFSSFVVDTTAPAKPTGLSAALTTLADASSAYADVNWTANIESDLAGYTIYYRKVGDNRWTGTSVDKDVTKPYRIPNLVPYVNYEFYITAYDWTANVSVPSNTATGTAGANSAPSQPQPPAADSNTQQIQVTPTGLKSGGGAMEGDVEFYEVYADTSTGFTPGPTNMLGVIPVGPAMATVFPIPASSSTPGATTQAWYVKVIAVDTVGLKSSASTYTTASPNLIGTLNVADAAITNAKITSLEVNKLIAGSGIINDFTVKAALTIGDATNNGYIRSYDWVTSSGTTGYEIAKNAITLRTGAIYAPALRIQYGQNLMPARYADFEGQPVSYNGDGTVFAFTDVRASANAKFNSQVRWQGWIAAGAGAISEAFLGKTATDYNIVVEPNTTYIVSAYVMKDANTPSAALWVKGDVSGAAAVTGASLNPITSTTAWTRISGTWTSGATDTKAIVSTRADASVAGSYFLDGVQFEIQETGATTPSPWTPPGGTSIDGGLIRTGSIISNQTVTINSVAVPTWSIPTNGAATFADLTVRGISVVGTAGDAGALNRSVIQSANYNGSVGWKIDANGTAFFANANVTGTINANSGTFSGNLSSTAVITGGTLRGSTIETNSTNTGSVRINGAGLVVYGPAGQTMFSADLASGGVYVAGTFTGNSSGTFSGALSAASGTFTGALSAATGSFTGSVVGGSFTSVPEPTYSTFVDIANGRISMRTAGGTGYGSFLPVSPRGIGMFGGTYGVDSGAVIAVRANGGISIIPQNGERVSIGQCDIGTIWGGISVVGDSVLEGYITATQRMQSDVGFFDTSATGSGAVAANFRSDGKLVRSSTIKMKEAIEDMTKEEAHSVLGLKSYTFEYKEADGYKDPRRYPGFIAEQAADAGAELWVARQHKVERDKDGKVKKIIRDKKGEINAFRTSDITVAHNVLIKELFEEIKELRKIVDGLDK